jgi:hypothetical protein
VFIDKIDAHYVQAATPKDGFNANPPVAIERYIKGLDGLPSKSDPAVKKYWKWLQTKLSKQEYKVYRGVALADEDDYPSFAKGHPMSFTESKSVASAIAKDRSKNGEDEQWGCVVEAVVPKKSIYFHYAFGGDLGTYAPKEKEILVLMDGISDWREIETYHRGKKVKIT